MEEKKAYCPNCGVELPKVPTRKTKCKVCMKYMYFKSSPYDRTKRLVSEEELVRLTAEWETYSNEQEILRMMYLHNQNAEDIDHIRSKLPKENQTAARIELEILYKVLQDPNHTQDNLWKLSRLIYLMDYFGKDTLELQLIAKKYEIKDLILKGFKKTEIYCFQNCIHYKSLHTLKLTAAKEFEHPRIPTRACTRNIDGKFKVCMCSYKPYFE